MIIVFFFLSVIQYYTEVYIFSKKNPAKDFAVVAGEFSSLIIPNDNHYFNPLLNHEVMLKDIFFQVGQNDQEHRRWISYDHYIGLFSCNSSRSLTCVSLRAE
ncbi:hypothetical protein COU87_04325 [Candidatus Roizmanbacteria bacterium CG10_big_fil_rev_8_21_14_0_10_39_12]|uniref:Uncharacterized protein n=1 Tax=Candidatus Roizmanbacteria bacterium CG10_big_fil_rev_8_21_14_0_10_39_12 TaxID=1974852 RepID=A0A2M8KNI7_9BACT|nr:MAG: hypothetical protein COU87_04325 [Candidatus Roizmanbacteria bacterium CG10_big_fil_rev_8_21_14_0_10_39_12]